MASIQTNKLKGGRRSYTVRWRGRSAGRGEQYENRTFRRRVDAEAFRAQLEADLSRGLTFDARGGRTPLGEWIAQHEATKIHRRPSTVARDVSYIRTHILPAFGDRPMKDIDPMDVRAWVAGMVESGRAPATVRKAHQLLSSALQAAVDDGLLPRNPARRVDPPRIEAAEMRFLAPEEVASLAEAIDPRYRGLVIAAAYTGCRFGELAALTDKRLNLLRRTLSVEETASEVSGVVHLGPPKTRAAIRSVTLPSVAVDALSAHLSAFPPDESGRVFTGPDGGWIRGSNFRHRVWSPAIRASVGEPCRFHDLRHTNVAMLIAAGQAPLVIAKRLGHVSVRTVLDVYGHLYPGLDEEAADALDALAIDSRADFVRVGGDEGR